MRIRFHHLVSLIFLALTFVCASAQNAGIDAALLTKANSGDPASQISVGECYSAGKVVEKNYLLAAEWYRKAAEQGNIAAELHLAVLYRDGGKGFARDPVQSMEWYRKAAEQNDVGAQATLGMLYSLGQGAEQNYVEAYYWLCLAASVKGPDQAKFAANRQAIGQHLTVDEVESVAEKVAKWQAEHPRADLTNHLSQ